MQNPLDKHLTKAGIPEARFAELMTASRGWKVHKSQISMWRTGARRPSRHTREVMARVSCGAIPIESWG